MLVELERHCYGVENIFLIHWGGVGSIQCYKQEVYSKTFYKKKTVANLTYGHRCDSNEVKVDAYVASCYVHSKLSGRWSLHLVNIVSLEFPSYVGTRSTIIL